jgi:hypothetical protein
MARTFSSSRRLATICRAIGAPSYTSGSYSSALRLSISFNPWKPLGLGSSLASAVRPMGTTQALPRGEGLVKSHQGPVGWTEGEPVV